MQIYGYANNKKPHFRQRITLEANFSPKRDADNAAKKNVIEKISHIVHF